MAVNSDAHDSGAARLIHSLARLSSNTAEQQIPLGEWSRRLQPAGAKSLRALRAKAAKADDVTWRAFCATLGTSDALAADLRAAAGARTLVPASQTDRDVLRALESPPFAGTNAELSGEPSCGRTAADVAIRTPARASHKAGSVLYTPFTEARAATMTKQDRERFAWPPNMPYQTLLTEDGSVVRGDLSKQMRSLIDTSEEPAAADLRRSSFGEPETATAYVSPESTPKAKGRAERGARRTARAARRRRREQALATDSTDSGPSSTRSSSEDDDAEGKRQSRTVTASGRKVTKRRRLSADEAERPEPRPAAVRPARLTRPIQADSPLRTRDYWITALNTLLARYPRNHVIVSETEVDPSGQPRLFCLDCERSYATGPGRTLQNFEKHLRRYGVHGLNPQSAAALQRQQQRAERERMAKEAEAAEKEEAEKEDEDEDEKEDEKKKKEEEEEEEEADVAQEKDDDRDEDEDEDAEDANRSSSPASRRHVRMRPAADTEADGEAADGADAGSNETQQQRACKIARVADSGDVTSAGENGNSSSTVSLLADEELLSPRPGTPHRRPLSEHAANSVTGALASPRKLMSPVEMLSPRLTSVQ